MNTIEDYEKKLKIHIPKNIFRLGTPYLNLLDLCRANVGNKEYFVAVGFLSGTCIDLANKGNKLLVRHCYLVDKDLNVMFDTGWFVYGKGKYEFKCNYATVLRIPIDAYINLTHGMSEGEIEASTSIASSNNERKVCEKLNIDYVSGKGELSIVSSSNLSRAPLRVYNTKNAI